LKVTNKPGILKILSIFTDIYHRIIYYSCKLRQEHPVISAERINSLFSLTLPQQSGYDNISNQALGRGIDAYLKQDYAGAVKEFKKSIALSPYSDYSNQAFEYLANAYINQNKTSDAVRTYKQAIQLNPSNDSAHLNLGNIYFKNSQFKEAEKEYAQAVRINPTSAMNRYALGETYLATDRYQEAQSQFRFVTQLTPGDTNGYDGLGQALRKLGKYGDAVVQFKKAISLDKKNADAYLDLGYTYADMKKLDLAQQQVVLLTKLDSGKAGDLQNYIKQASDPKLTVVFSTSGFPLQAGRGTLVSSITDELSTANATDDFTMTFMFSKDMDPTSVQNPSNWQIRKATRQDPGGAYNLGLSIPATEIAAPSAPYRVTYDAGGRVAQLTFRITQNSSGTGTIDPSHLIFKFKGVDAYGQTMDSSADEYSGISKIV
jgi:tetratricopeptide (TPR) repeat protein